MKGAPGVDSSALPVRGTDDDDLMARVAERDADAFRALAERHGALPHRIAWRMIGDAAEAEDIAQEAFLRLWDKAAQWRSGGSGVAAWLTRVAMNLALDRLRRRRFASDEAVPEHADGTAAGGQGRERGQGG